MYSHGKMDLDIHFILNLKRNLLLLLYMYFCGGNTVVSLATAKNQL